MVKKPDLLYIYRYVVIRVLALFSGIFRYAANSEQAPQLLERVAKQTIRRRSVVRPTMFKFVTVPGYCSLILATDTSNNGCSQ